MVVLPRCTAGNGGDATTVSYHQLCCSLRRRVSPSPRQQSGSQVEEGATVTDACWMSLRDAAAARRHHHNAIGA